MATHRIDRKIGHTWLIDKDHDTWILGEKGRIVVLNMQGILASDAIDAATIRIDGTIQVNPNGDFHTGVELRARKAFVTIGETGHVSTNTAAIYYENDTGAVTIDNAGLLQGKAGIFALARQDRAAISNTGRIDATGNGIVAIGAGADIVNSGVIKADYGIQALAKAGDVDFLDAERATHITNSGKVTGLSASIYSGSGFDVAVNLRNKGTLNGDVLLVNGEDVVNNRGGTINGDVWLGSNNDRFDGRGGRLNGILYGGDGMDTVTLASPATLYVENAGEGTDTVRINATYRLGANVEVLTLLGKANHAGIGNGVGNIITGNKGANALYGLDGGDAMWGSMGRDRLFGGDGNDMLDGGKGRDVLTGGADIDYFRFQPGYGRDTITDFEIGTDNILVVGFGDKFGTDPADFDDLVNIMSPSGDDTIIRFSDTDMLILRNILYTDLTWDEFAVFP